MSTTSHEIKEYVKHTGKAKPVLAINGLYECPICRVPAIYSNNISEICPCCKWKNDDVKSESPSIANNNLSPNQYRKLFLNQIRNTKTENLMRDYINAKTREEQNKASIKWLMFVDKEFFSSPEEKHLYLKEQHCLGLFYHFIRNMANEVFSSEKRQYELEDLEEITDIITSDDSYFFSYEFLSDYDNISVIDKTMTKVSKTSADIQEAFIEMILSIIYDSYLQNPEDKMLKYVYEKLRREFAIKINEFYFIRGKLIGLSHSEQLTPTNQEVANLIKYYYKLTKDDGSKRALNAMLWLQSNSTGKQ